MYEIVFYDKYGENSYVVCLVCWGEESCSNEGFFVFEGEDFVDLLVVVMDFGCCY